LSRNNVNEREKGNTKPPGCHVGAELYPDEWAILYAEVGVGNGGSNIGHFS
jgi:hypothetical protein